MSKFPVYRAELSCDSARGAVNGTRAPGADHGYGDHHDDGPDHGIEHVLLRIPDIALHADEFFATLGREHVGHERFQHFVDRTEGNDGLDRQVIAPPALDAELADEYLLDRVDHEQAPTEVGDTIVVIARGVQPRFHPLA